MMDIKILSLDRPYFENKMEKRDELLTLWDLFDLEHISSDSDYFNNNISYNDKIRRLDRYLDGDDRGIAGAIAEGRILGFSAYQKKVTPDVSLLRKRSFLEMHVIIVDQDFRYYGIAEALFRHLILITRDAGLDRIECGIWEFNEKMKSFSKKMGFKTISRKVSFKI